MICNMWQRLSILTRPHIGLKLRGSFESRELGNGGVGKICWPEGD
jgi:hypothetical protein